MGSNQSSNNGRKRKRLGGLRDMRTAVKARMRTKPQVEGQEYLDMYSLSRDRARWARMATQSAEVIEAIDEELARIVRTLPAFGHTQNEGDGPQSPRKRVGKNFGTFKLDY